LGGGKQEVAYTPDEVGPAQEDQIGPDAIRAVEKKAYYAHEPGKALVELEVKTRRRLTRIKRGWVLGPGEGNSRNETLSTLGGKKVGVRGKRVHGTAWVWSRGR